MTDLFQDGFDGPLDPRRWAYPVGNASFYGDTQIRASLPSVSGGQLHLALDLFNPTARVPGDSFYGSEAITNQSFGAPTAGPSGSNAIVFEVRARFAVPAGGIVGGIFPYFLFDPTGTHDEIDYELLSNDAVTGANRADTNIYSRAPGNSVGNPQFVPDQNITQFRVYRIEWRTNSVSWFIDGALVRQTTSNIPTQPMALHLNIWAPTSSFAPAYNSGLRPVASAAANATFALDADYVTHQSVT